MSRITRPVDQVPPIGRMIWSQKHTARLESHWMSFQRLMYLNHMTGWELQCALARLAGPAKKQRQLWQSELPYWYEKLNAAGRPLERFRASLGLLEISRAMQLNRGWLGYTNDLRFCKHCLEQCFHSILFQYPFVRHCPYHQIELQQHCPSCSAPLGTDALSSPFATVAPLRCKHCSALFFSSERPIRQIVAGFPESEAVFNDAHQQLEDLLRGVISQAPLATLHDREVIWDWRFCFNSLSKCMAAERITEAWMEAAKPREVTLVSAATAVSDNGEKPTWILDMVAAVHLLEDLARVLRAIDHELRFHCREICGHRQPSALVTGWHRAAWGGEDTPHLCLQSGDCPICACLSWWRAHFGIYFNLRTFMREHSTHAVRTRDLNELARSMPMEPQQLALMALALFAFLAHAMRELTLHVAQNSASETPPTDALSNQDLGSFWSAGPHPCLWRLKLKLHRIPDATLRLSREGQLFLAKYSLRSAWQDLEACKNVIAQHKKKESRRLLWIESNKSRPGHWYEAFSFAQNERHWLQKLV